MKSQAFCNFLLSGVSLTDFGLKIPSPFSSLKLDNSQIDSITSWSLSCTVGGDDTLDVNVAAFEALLYSAAQSNIGTAGIPVSFIFGWLDEHGNISSQVSYQGFTLQFSVSTSGQYLQYTLNGYAQLAQQTHMPVLNIPAISGVVQPSAIVEALAKSTHADLYYDLDIDHNDSPTYVSHGALTTSFNTYVGGKFTGEDDYDTFPGLAPLSKSYNTVRDSSGLDILKSKKLSTVLNNISVSPITDFLRKSNDDTTPQCSSFSYWVDEPTMTKRGVIHYKSEGGRLGTYSSDILQYGTANTNILTLQGSYNGIAYNMTDMSFSSIGFQVNSSGQNIANDFTVVNSWSNSVEDVFQTANIINDVNALASQFSGDFTITIPGNTKQYQIAQPISLIVMSKNTLSPISGIYNIISVSQQISTTFITELKVKRLMMSSANQVAANQGIFIKGSQSYMSALESKTNRTSNIISTGKVDLGVMYPTFKDLYSI